jgi:hypothetical protein
MPFASADRISRRRLSWAISPDRYLTVRQVLHDTPAVTITDSNSDVSPEASLYYPSPDWKHGIAVYANGNVALWDAPSRRQIAKIDIDGELSAASFCPDDSMVATTSGHENKDHSSTFHLRISDPLSICARIFTVRTVSHRPAN